MFVNFVAELQTQKKKRKKKKKKSQNHEIEKIMKLFHDVVKCFCQVCSNIDKNVPQKHEI